MPQNIALKLKFIGALVEQLGAQLYPSATATVAELISNAWDADAQSVWVTVPFGEDWRPESDITVLDDGHGMTREDAANAYLIVGRKRRVESGLVTPSGRKVHGRKGIGKLAAFGTARLLECATLREDDFTTFRLDYDHIRNLDPGEHYPVEPALDNDPLINPETGDRLSSGTRIKLTSLHLKRALSEFQFRQSMSRRFAVGTTQMRVLINGVPLDRFSVPLQIKFPRDGVPRNDITIDEEGWAVDQLPSGKDVRWWIGFTEAPLDDESLLGISVVANGKMVQRPFRFERSSGTTGQLGQEYLIGEVEANWIDSGSDIEDDLIQSNRDQLQLEDPRLDEFLLWGRQRLRWALRKRNDLRADLVLARFEVSENIQSLLAPFTTSERDALMRVAASISKVPEITPESLDSLMGSFVNAREDVIVRQMMERIQEEESATQERMWGLVREFGLIDARRTQSLLEARLETISKLKDAVQEGAREVPEIHNIVKEDAWLLDPRWHLLDDEVDIRDLGIEYDPEIDSGTGQYMDFLFALQPGSPAPVDEVVVVEIKRATYPDGSNKRASVAEVQKFQRYVAAAKDHFTSNSSPPRVRGLMIAEGYASNARSIRSQLEQVSDPKLEFKTWGRVIDETERMHLGWLNVSRRRTVQGS